MRRRDFLRGLGAAGLALSSGCEAGGEYFAATLGDASLPYEPPPEEPALCAPGLFDLHPALRAAPDAVFVAVTGVEDKLDAEAIRGTAFGLARELIVPVCSGGHPTSTRVLVKPNWTRADPVDGQPVPERLGTTTDRHFIEGWIQGMKTRGLHRFAIRECARPSEWEAMGWSELARRNRVDFRDLSTRNFWELEEGTDVRWLDVPDGVVSKQVAYMAPATAPDTILVNIAKLKSHSMGVTGAVKNLQGLCARRFHQFCTTSSTLFTLYEPPYHRYFHSDLEERIGRLHRQHVQAGIPRWDRPGGDGGVWMEQWCQRTLDHLQVLPTFLNMVEAIYAQDGNGFGKGPHPPLGPNGVTSRDHLTNLIIFGRSPLRVDLVAHYLAGHDPRAFGLFHLARERGLCPVIDAREVPLFLWEGGAPSHIALADLPRARLLTPYLRQDYDGMDEAPYHLVA